MTELPAWIPIGYTLGDGEVHTVKYRTGEDEWMVDPLPLKLINSWVTPTGGIVALYRVEGELNP